MRPYRGSQGDGTWRYGFYRAAGGVAYIDEVVDGRFVTYVVIPESVGQSTGLKDKNGEKVFAGDIAIYTWAAVGVLGQCNKESVVEWNKAMARFDGCPNGCEVIGNIHDNPELIKE